MVGIAFGGVQAIKWAARRWGPAHAEAPAPQVPDPPAAEPEPVLEPASVQEEDDPARESLRKRRWRIRAREFVRAGLAMHSFSRNAFVQRTTLTDPGWRALTDWLVSLELLRVQERVGTFLVGEMDEIMATLMDLPDDLPYPAGSPPMRIEVENTGLNANPATQRLSRSPVILSRNRRWEMLTEAVLIFVVFMIVTMCLNVTKVRAKVSDQSALILGADRSAHSLAGLPEPILRARQATLDSLTRPNSKRAYARDIDAYLTWCSERGQPAFHLATLEAYKADLLAEGKKAATVNRYLSSVRALLKKVGQLYPEVREQAEIAREVRSVSQAGSRVGVRLSLDETHALVDTPPADTLRGLRDRALLAVLFGCLLRRRELVTLRWADLRQVDGHWCFVDLQGKGGRVRTVKVEAWVYRRLMAYAEAAGLDVAGGGPIFVRLRKGGGGRVVGDGEAISSETVYKALKRYAPNLAPHDARRTGAHLARKHGAPLEQVQHLLGHASVTTTERYTGIEVDLDDSATGYIGLSGR